ncbi:type II toxin-antitoxin system Phd/YefM family antitoxin [Massilia sp. BJB1822]|uniref:type II toxin-antitoxin system Phd/YefM family antitoxin n=1 Tax=Massilia sp. BJB1822 TaxID=2744470 RepID=UPI0015939FAE|nr:type II toxin-antitoxin system Phd/YefM family antitoxin [Massilia sp. BJB1822]NVE01605.1 type II toxin-antitoxin system Phd/YefM family antitoxin [Massilia sp. BJB1822]
MSSLKAVQPISFLKTNPGDVVKQAQESQAPVMITVNGKVQAVVQDAVSYQRTQDQLNMLRILVHGQKQIAEGKISDHDEFFKELESEDQDL